MAVSVEFQNEFVKWKARYERLRKVCGARLDVIAKQHHGIFVDRLKSEESTFSKVESGKYKRPFEEIVDVYAATIAVATLVDVEVLAEKVLDEFVEVSRTTARSNLPKEFVYDDLHLVLRLKDSNLIEDKDLLGLSFELQLKSMLQFAWSKATHDVVYKGDRISWADDRLVAEVKAALELIDQMFANVEGAAALLKEKDNQEYTGHKALLDAIQRRCAPGSLPPDLKRTVFAIDNYRKTTGWGVDQVIAELFDAAADAVVGSDTLTPVQMFLAIVCTRMTDAERNTWFDAVRAERRSFHLSEAALALFPVLDRIPADLRVELNP